MEKLKGWTKTKTFWVIIGVVILSVGYGLGYDAAKTDIDGERVNYDGLVAKAIELEGDIKRKETRLSEVNEELEIEEAKLNDKQSEVEEVFALIDDKESIADEISSMDGQLSSKQDELDVLNEQIGDKEKELATLEGKVLEAAGEPIKLNSGQYIVGIDFPEGRYQASGSSNFFVYSSTGSMKVNTILGDGIVGDGDYVFFATEGDFIETNSQTTLTPVQ